MTKRTLGVLLLAGSVIAVGACNKAGGEPARPTRPVPRPQTPLLQTTATRPQAQSAAPSAISSGASIVTVDAKAQCRRSAKEPTAGPACPTTRSRPGRTRCALTKMPANGSRPGLAINRRPKTSSGSCTCWKAVRTPATPILMRPSRRPENNWVKTPHIMVVGSKDILQSHPAGAKPDTAVPCDVGGYALTPLDDSGRQAGPNALLVLSVGDAEAGSSGQGCLG